MFKLTYSLFSPEEGEGSSGGSSSFDSIFTGSDDTGSEATSSAEEGQAAPAAPSVSSQQTQPAPAPAPTFDYAKMGQAVAQALPKPAPQPQPQVDPAQLAAQREAQLRQLYQGYHQGEHFSAVKALQNLGVMEPTAEQVQAYEEYQFRRFGATAQLLDNSLGQFQQRFQQDMQKVIAEQVQAKLREYHSYVTGSASREKEGNQYLEELYAKYPDMREHTDFMLNNVAPVIMANKTHPDGRVRTRDELYDLARQVTYSLQGKTPPTNSPQRSQPSTGNQAPRMASLTMPGGSGGGGQTQYNNGFTSIFKS